MRVSEMICKAFVDAKEKAPKRAPTAKELHRARSVAWVKALTKGFQAIYPVSSCYRVFSKPEKSNKADFRLSELLFDLAVCEVRRTASARGGHDLWYVAKAVWQVESEFAEDSRAAVLDFSKLVLGGAPNKLFVAPITDCPSAFSGPLLAVARCCSGRVFPALVPHPRDWDTDLAPEAFVFATGGWMACDAEAVRDDG